MPRKKRSGNLGRKQQASHKPRWRARLPNVVARKRKLKLPEELQQKVKKKGENK